jgi:hypothetical protein
MTSHQHGKGTKATVSRRSRRSSTTPGRGRALAPGQVLDPRSDDGLPGVMPCRISRTASISSGLLR